MHDFAIHRERFHLAMREVKDGAARRLVNAAPLHSDKTVLHHVDAADAVLAANLVQRLHDTER